MNRKLTVELVLKRSREMQGYLASLDNLLCVSKPESTNSKIITSAIYVLRTVRDRCDRAICSLERTTEGEENDRNNLDSG